MVMTILEARVDRQQWQTLVSNYSEVSQDLDPGIVQTFLIQSKSDETLWRILTVWEDMAALQTMRQSGETPRGVVMFRAAGANPELSIFDVAASAIK